MGKGREKKKKNELQNKSQHLIVQIHQWELQKKATSTLKPKTLFDYVKHTYQSDE
jgi:hypothetical protein